MGLKLLGMKGILWSYINKIEDLEVDMKTIIELDKDDIRRLVVKEFDVKEEQISVIIKPVYRRCGIYEHKENEVFVTINK